MTEPSMTDELEYILGTDDAELRRLQFQHHAWAGPMHAILARAGLRTGATVVDLGCGPGYTTLELAETVGPAGRVIARDLSARFLAHLERVCTERGIAHIECSIGGVESLALPPGSIDAAYARWLFCWLPDPAAAVATIAESLRAGGALIVQDYIHWASMRLLPRDARHDAVVAACMRSWELGGGDIDVGAQLPEYATAARLVVESFEPVERIGGVGSLEWRWISEFYASYAPRLVEGGLLSQSDADDFAAFWAEQTRVGGRRILTPMMADLVLRKPE